ncbi:Ribonuclease HII [Anaplasma phagocytophilum]|uniref:Ribonuclease HII n=2 Tax=Anaplasma phagocytophilum TaxID=948 RepID=A0AA45UTM6_ANAPH|nr:ribonuclease HII [Anaplasma phagocytophilum]ANC34506.1 ribonuclease HII [Anaplasma phagocytophilum str. Norway variant2]SBO14388.1 Ribonuclease HII [Anaplasma phagocytophilum]
MPNFSYEDSFSNGSNAIVVGVDEVGYGSIAGPVVAAAVYIPDRNVECIPNIKDSKLLTPKKRDALYKELLSHTVCGTGLASIDEIAEHNILVASHMAMRRALENLNLQRIDLVLVDGSRELKSQWTSKSIINGDELSISIAAASIVAKVTRDNMMRELHDQYPEYHWNKNCGYGTAAHILALKQHGATPLHRKTFAPVKKCIISTKNQDK